MARFIEDDEHLTIRMQHYGTRFLSLVLFITSIVCFNNPKKPDGPILGVSLAIVVIILLMVSRSVSIDLDRASDRFAIRYGGILFGVPKRMVERPLGELVYASTENTSNAGLARTTMKPGSRVVFVFSSQPERVPLTKFLSGGDMGVHHEIENRVNAFVKRHRSRSRM